MRAKISILATLLASIVSPGFAGWEYDGYHVGDGYYQDDGSKFVLGFHGGFSMSRAKMKNEMGSLYADYYMNDATGTVVSTLSFLNAFGDDPAEWPEGYSHVGEGDLSTLPIKQDFKKNTFTAGAEIGFTLPNSPKWRLELAYDYIAETSYNQTPLLEGEMTVTGESGDSVVHVFSTGAKSTISTDIVSAMVYYDFFDGKYKQLHDFIPYVGLGLGYAVSKTMLQISDIYGDLSLDEDLQNYGTPNASGVLQFDNPTDGTKYPASTNIAVLGALGFSYGIAESTFVDASLRLMYIPKISWNIVNSDGTQYREWFSAENMIYTSFIIGLRFEF
ncbi:MAG: outer membrane beta-barrel protein [Alphaproteobacteria bacterium]|nr:outer membrane beta-barrel protein [Alphaproteobacteria bacterium]